jgi:hypothetical protein
MEVVLSGIIRKHPEILLEVLRKTTIHISQDIRCPGQDLNQELPKEKPHVLLLEPICLITFTFISH